MYGVSKNYENKKKSKNKNTNNKFYVTKVDRINIFNFYLKQQNKTKKKKITNKLPKRTPKTKKKLNI